MVLLFNRIGSWQAKMGMILYAIIYVFFGFLWLPKIFKVQCQVCGWRGKKFYDLDCGSSVANAGVCPSCWAQPRQAILFLYLQKVIPKNKKLKVLHFAPEIPITKLFQSYPLIDYLSVDANPAKAMKQEDISRLSFVDNSFDIIFCSHVLEHVEEGNRAMRELYRVLKPGGFAIIDVLIDYENEKTYEDLSVTSPGVRMMAFWQHDHKRLYGKDFPDKLKNIGFLVKEDNFFLEVKKRKKTYGRLPNHPIYFCTKSC